MVGLCNFSLKLILGGTPAVMNLIKPEPGMGFISVHGKKGKKDGIMQPVCLLIRGVQRVPRDLSLQ